MGHFTKVTVVGQLVCVLALAGCPAQRATQGEANIPRVVPASACLAGERSAVPQLLSATGCVDSTDVTRAAPGMIPFSPNAPLWTDGADKERWFSIPAGTTVEIDERGDFIFPVGTVLLKTFTIEGRRIETRLLMHHPDGWAGYPYVWNEAGDDAVLTTEGARLEAVQPDGTGWTVPSAASCMGCHNQETHVAMGLELAQQNGPLDHPGSEHSDNQLTLLQALGVLEPIAFPLSSLPALVDYRDPGQPLDDRARAYLHANCSSCHTAPENLCSGDLRFTADLGQMGVCDVEAKLPLETGLGAMLLKPGQPDQSAIVARMQAEPGSPLAMPPVGREHVDQQGVELIRAWIAAMEGCE